MIYEYEWESLNDGQKTYMKTHYMKTHECNRYLKIKPRQLKNFLQSVAIIRCWTVKDIRKGSGISILDDLCDCKNSPGVLLVSSKINKQNVVSVFIRTDIVCYFKNSDEIMTEIKKQKMKVKTILGGK